MTLLWIVIAVLTYIVFSRSYNDQKASQYINDLNDSQQSFQFDLTHAVLSQPLVRELLGFENYPTDFSKWEDNDKNRWFEVLKKHNIEGSLCFSLTYIPVTNIFLVSYKDRIYPAISEMIKRQLLHETLIGDPLDFHEPKLSLCIVERFLLDERVRVITGYLRYQKGFREASKTIILFDFPYKLVTDEEMLGKFDFTTEKTNSDPHPSDLAGFHERTNEIDMWKRIDYKNNNEVEISSSF